MKGYALLATIAVMTGIATAKDVAPEAKDAAPEDKLIAFHTSVRVDVDASGKPVSVRAPDTLPAVVREHIEHSVALWGYQPARRDGVAVAATTFVTVGVCARPDGDRIWLGMDFKGNGPRLLSPSHRLPVPWFPVDAVRAGAEGRFNVNYTVLPDGTTRVDSVEALDRRAMRGYGRAFEQSLTSWAKGLRYEPEQVAGVAVATQQSVPVSFGVSPGRWKPEPVNPAATKAECREAAGSGLSPVAIDSPVTVRVTPKPAG